MTSHKSRIVQSVLEKNPSLSCCKSLTQESTEQRNKEKSESFDTSLNNHSVAMEICDDVSGKHS